MSIPPLPPSITTRDSRLWRVLPTIGAVVIGLSTLTNPADYGIPLVAMPYIKLTALVFTLSGLLGTSPLPHSVEGDAKITPSGR